MLFAAVLRPRLDRGLSVWPGRADGYEELRLMLIRTDDHSFVDDLCAHYRRSGFHAESVGGGVIEVARPDAADEEQERREVLMHLRVWEISNPNAHAELL
jgi:hypothetical protein